MHVQLNIDNRMHYRLVVNCNTVLQHKLYPKIFNFFLCVNSMNVCNLMADIELSTHSACTDRIKTDTQLFCNIYDLHSLFLNSQLVTNR